jgi:hypothetical protein
MNVHHLLGRNRDPLPRFVDGSTAVKALGAIGCSC